MHHAHIDKFAYQDSWFHRLDSRVKLVVTVVYTAVVLSLPATSMSLLFCYAAAPFAVLVMAGIPLGFVFRHILLTSPFVLALALSGPLYDNEPVQVFFGPLAWATTSGWLRGLVILGKFCISMMAILGLVSTTRFSSLLAGLQRLHVPEVLVIQLGFLYRYLFVLIDTVHHMRRAASARRVHGLGLRREIQIAGAMIGSLLVRSLDQADRIHRAMLGRGFQGHWHSVSRDRISARDWVYAAMAAVVLVALHGWVRPAFR
jgi:cobalt/nickel transport system permease protein